MTATPSARLRELLGDDAVGDDILDAGAWADGYGITSPDVVRYTEMLGGLPDAMTLAMRNLAAEAGHHIVDRGTAHLIEALVRSHHPKRVVEAGTGVGFLTMHLARAVAEDCVLVSADDDPILQGTAHGFLQHLDPACTVELRLGDPARVLGGRSGEEATDILVLSSSTADRVSQLDSLFSTLAPDALVLAPWALRGGRVADGLRDWSDAPEVESQRAFNRAVATHALLTGVTLVPVGDGLLVARRG